MSTANVSLGSLNPYAAGDDGKQQNIFFDADSTSPTSQVIQVNLEPYYIQAFNLVTGDEITLEIVMGNGSGTLFAPCCPVFGPIKLTPDRTKVRLDQPGRYRLHYTAGGHLGQFHAVGYYGTMTQESTMDLAEALRNAIAGVSISGTDPIVVTGLGTTASPYIISANQATNLQEENGVPAQYLINAGTLKHIVNATTASQNATLGVNAEANGVGAVSIGFGAGAGASGGSTGAVCIGLHAGENLGILSVEMICIGSGAGNHAAGSGTTCIGPNTFVFGAAQNAVVIGIGAGASASALANGMVAIGDNAGTNAGSGGLICIGRSANYAGNGAATGSIIIGDSAGSGAFGLKTGANIIAIGTSSGRGSNVASDISNSIFIGANTASLSYNGSANNIGIGENAGYGSGYSHCIGIGTGARGVGGAGISLGKYAGVYSASGIRIGRSETTQTDDMINDADRIMIGTHTGDGSTGLDLMAIGRNAARYSSMADVVAIGRNAYSNIPVGAVAITPTFTQAAITPGSSPTPGSINIPGHGLTIGTDINVYVNLVSGRQLPVAAQALSSVVGDVWNIHVTDANNVSLGVGATAGTFVYVGSGTFQLYDLTGVTFDYTNVICIGAETQPTMDNQAIIGNASVTQLVTAGSVISGGAIIPSDKRLKNNVADYKNGLDFINQVRPVTFSWNEIALKQGNVPHLRTDLPKTHYGVIADEFQQLMPDMVENVNHGFGDYKFVRYERTIPLLYSAIKELASQVKELSSEVAKCKKTSSKVQEKDNG